MKKILYLFFTCSIIFAFAGCSPSKKDSAEATTTQEIATTTSTTENTTDSSTSDSDAKNDSYDFSAYKKRIKKLTKKVNNAASSSNASVNEKRFFRLIMMRVRSHHLKELGYKNVAMALTDRSVSIDDEALMSEDKLAIILGTEGDGLCQETIDACDYTVKIPMAHGVDSLNVAAASAVAFWQLAKRK